MHIHNNAQVRQQEAARIPSLLREVPSNSLAKYPVDAAYAYGSVARGTFTPFSDVAITLVSNKALSAPNRLIILEREIQAAI
jgi:predicted nucleotidyltransferase